jgi:hypothetical protein
MWRGQQFEPRLEGIAGQEPDSEQAQFRAGDEHHLGSLPA